MFFIFIFGFSLGVCIFFVVLVCVVWGVGGRDGVLWVVEGVVGVGKIVGVWE